MSINSVLPEKVAEAFKKSGRGWLVEHSSAAQILTQTTRDLGEFADEYQRRFGERPDPFALLDEIPHKGRAFFQVFVGTPITLDMRILIWRLLLGVELLAIRLDYKREGDFELVVALETHKGEREEYRSTNAWDFRVLRQVGLLSVDGQAILDGFFAFAQ